MSWSWKRRQGECWWTVQSWQGREDSGEYWSNGPSVIKLRDVFTLLLTLAVVYDY